jgi:hypothetical protein
LPFYAGIWGFASWVSISSLPFPSRICTSHLSFPRRK